MLFAFGYLLVSLIVSVFTALFNLAVFAFTLLVKLIKFICSIINENRNRKKQSQTQTNIAAPSQQN